MAEQFGYARVSSKEQNLDRQIEALQVTDGNGYKYLTDERHLITDKASGKDFQRDGWQVLMRMLRAGDTLTVVSLDRLSRNYDQLKTIWKELTDKGVKIRVLDMPAISTADKPDDDLTAKLISDITLSLLGYVAETERQHIKERQAQGIATAKAKGKHLGRPAFQKPENYSQIMQEHKDKKITAVQAAKELGVSRAMFYKLLNADKGE